MLQKLRDEWRKFRESREGERFVEYHERAKAQHGAIHIVLVVAGVFVTLAGVIMLVAPGPGILFMFFGLALIATRSRALAVALDHVEVWMRRIFRKLARWWTALPWPIAAGIVALTVAAATGIGAAAWRWLS